MENSRNSICVECSCGTAFEVEHIPLFGDRRTYFTCASCGAVGSVTNEQVRKLAMGRHLSTPVLLNI